MNENELESGIEAETTTDPVLAVDGALALDLDLEPEITREQRRSRRKRFHQSQHGRGLTCDMLCWSPS